MSKGPCRLTDINLSILADDDCPSDWEREDLLVFAQEAAREILKLRAKHDDEETNDGIRWQLTEKGRAR